MTNLTPDEQAMRERCEKATKGDWEFKRDRYADDAGNYPLERLVSGDVVVLKAWGLYAEDYGISISDDDADFIAHARTDVPALLTALEAERAENAELYKRLSDADDRMAAQADELESLRGENVRLEERLYSAESELPADISWLVKQIADSDMTDDPEIRRICTKWRTNTKLYDENASLREKVRKLREVIAPVVRLHSEGCWNASRLDDVKRVLKETE